MSKTLSAAWLCLLLFAVTTPQASYAGSTAYTNSDNTNNANTGVPDNDVDVYLGRNSGVHPIEFNINISALPTTSAVLTVYAYDVDEEQGETDNVYINGSFLGRLTGANNVWSSTAFNVPLNLLTLGNNLVRVNVDANNGGWMTTVDWGQLLLDGGSTDNGEASDVRIVSYSINAGTVTINTQTTVQSVTGGNYRLETSIIDPNGNATSVLQTNFSATAGESVTVNQAPTYALNNISGTYTIQAQLFYITGGFPLQQNIDTAQFVHTANVGPSDNDNDGLTNTQEATLGTNPNNADTDGDGALDAAEVGNVNSPTDSDGDGTIDALESSIVDTDNDGVMNQSDPANTNPCVPNSNHAACLAYDSDGDGLTNGQEDTLGTDRNSNDTDGDGALDAAEVGNVNSPTDSDGDGTIDALESSIVDTDNDGVSNQNDAANTNPCVPNSNHAACLAYDSDGDGLTNGQEDTLGTDRNAADTDGDGENDAAEVGGNVNAPLNSDGDSVIDALESSIVDSDGDGFSNEADIANSNPCVPNSNSAACLNFDSDGDGLTNAQEDALGTGRNNPDTDGDGLNDGAEVGNVLSPTDGDGDGVINALESSIVDTDGDGYMNQNDSNNTNPCVPDSNTAACLAYDSDGDGLTNGQEDALGTNRNNADSDGDGESDSAEVGGNVSAPLNNDGDSIIDALESSIVDTDGDGVNNEADIANTNPCVPNGNSAACLAYDSDGDGLTNSQEDAIGTDRNNADTDGDGANDGAEVGGNPNSPVDTDGDGIPDALESGNGDTDGDGTPDAIDTDSDNDGIPDSVERNSNGTPRDTDGDGLADHLDRDSDNDRIPDAMEAGSNAASPVDTDNDGIADYLDRDSDNDGLPDQLESNASGIDSDADGIVDAFDVDVIGGGDANNDGVSDAAALPDTDGDGVADVRDIDSDSDGIADRVEGNATGVDHDNDGIDNAMDVSFTGGTDANNDGIDDAYVFPDTDGDGIADFRDLDTDNDGVFDTVEAGFTDADSDALLDAGLTVTYAPTDSDNDSIGDFRELDSNNDGTRDIVTAGYGSLDANNDGRIDGAVDADGDGILSPRDTAPAVFGSFVDTDGDGVADVADQDVDNDGIPNDDDGYDDADGDGIPNYMDRDSDNDGVTDTREAGGTDNNGDGVIDNFVDTNNNGIADSVEPGLGGTALPVPDTDRDGETDHRDIDSDGDGINDTIEAGGNDANNDGRVDDGADSDNDGLPDVVDGDVTGGRPLTPPDSDGDGTPDMRDLDSDGDGFTDAQERTMDTNGNGVPDYRDSSNGKLGTAVRGVGSFDAVFALLLCFALALRFVRVRKVLLPVLAMSALVQSNAQASDTAEAHKGKWYVGADVGPSWLEPRNIDAGYAVDDKTSFGYRVVVGHQTFTSWSLEAFYIDTGEAGIKSDNPSIGRLGTVNYKLMGLGTEWTPLPGGRSNVLYPILKAGLVHTENSASDPRINYEVENEVSLYFGAAGVWKFAKTWRAQLELSSYDKDELMLTVGVRKTFGK